MRKLGGGVGGGGVDVVCRSVDVPRGGGVGRGDVGSLALLPNSRYALGWVAPLHWWVDTELMSWVEG